MGLNFRWVASLVVLFFLVFSFQAIAVERYDEEKGGEGQGGMFLLQNPKRVVKTEGGDVRVFRGFRRRGTSTPMHVGFINMEPSTLFIPQYMDASLILFVRRGEMRIGWIYKDELVEKNLKVGDVYRIPAGSAFYMVNVGEGQRLQIICSIDTTESLGNGPFQSFFIGGGSNPTSVLAGFDMRTLTTAFNVSAEELSTIMGRQKGGPIVYVRHPDQPRKWASLMKLKHKERRAQMAWDEDDEGIKDQYEREAEESSGGGVSWSWRKLLTSLLLGDDQNKKDKRVASPESYNLYERAADFKNNYGWSVAVDEHTYSPLKWSGIGVYFVNLTAGSMMAPHVNPTATEYGVILRGSGSIQVVFPNGSLAMNAQVQEGDVFWVPRYFPFCQIASHSGPMEFFGFTTSARRNRPQFLVGRSSILQTMSGPEMATAFDVTEERLKELIDAQEESIILPTWPLSPTPRPQLSREEWPQVVKKAARELFVGFD